MSEEHLLLQAYKLHEAFVRFNLKIQIDSSSYP